MKREIMQFQLSKKLISEEICLTIDLRLQRFTLHRLYIVDVVISHFY